jgi:hypothetical protein
VEVRLSFTGNDGANTGQLIQNTSQEALGARTAVPTEPDRRFRDAGWWPSAGTTVRVVLFACVVLIAVGWVLTLLNK